MSRNQIINAVLDELNRENIRYCILRNYEFLIDPNAEPGFDLDISIAVEDQEKAKRTFIENGFIEKPPQFSLKHQGYQRFATEDMQNIGFDVQWGGVVWNDVYYLKEVIYARRKKVDAIYILSDEDAFIMYLCHSLLGKRYFKSKYQKKLQELAQKDLDISYIRAHLGKTFGNLKLGDELVTLVKNNKFDELLKLRHKLIRRFISGHYWSFTKLFFRWLKEKKLPRKHPLIAFIGPDGSGKSTLVAALKVVLEKNRRTPAVIYLGRGKKNVLPIAAPGKLVKKSIKSTQTLKKIIYTCASPIYTLDLLLRYLFIVCPKRWKHITITDRYATDIYLIPNVSKPLCSFLFRLFPKPTLTFYLYNDVKTLYERKQHPIEELKKQLELFEELSILLSAIRIKTNDKNEVLKKVAVDVFAYLSRKGF